MYNENTNEILKFAKNLTLLYVEDNEETVSEVNDILMPYFGKVLIANDGKEAFEIYNKYKNNIDLVLSDIYMPKMNGIELLSKIREVDQSISIIMLTAHSQTEYLIDTIRYGVDGYILKPMEFDSFFNVLKKVIKKIKIEKENYEYKLDLEKKVKEETEKRLTQEKIAERQNKMAAMGEMIDAIAHQWKQPLNIIGMSTDLIEEDIFRSENIDLESLEYSINLLRKQKEHMLETMEEFRSFFRVSEELLEFNILKCVNSVLLLIKDELIINKIVVDLEIEEDFILTGNINEFKHLVLNLINNSKDAFIENKVENRKILIKSFSEKEKRTIIFKDNAGGIKKEHLTNIFKVNYTTKSKDKGTGIGLYLSRQIANKMNCNLSVKNEDSGVIFLLEKNIR